MQDSLDTVLLQVLENDSLPVNSVTMSEGEVVHALVHLSILLSQFVHLLLIH